MKYRVVAAKTFHFTENSELLLGLSEKLKAKIILIQRNNVPTPKYSEFRKILGNLSGIEVIVESWSEIRRRFSDAEDLTEFKLFACKKLEHNYFFLFIGKKMIFL